MSELEPSNKRHVYNQKRQDGKSSLWCVLDEESKISEVSSDLFKIYIMLTFQKLIKDKKKEPIIWFLILLNGWILFYFILGSYLGDYVWFQFLVVVYVQY